MRLEMTNNKISGTRCDCGTERYVLERSLQHGGSQRCGCLRMERARQATAHDLFGVRPLGS